MSSGISIREFARRLQINEKTIRDGIKMGKISKGVIIENGKPKINYSIALKEAQDIGLGRKSTNKQPEHKPRPETKKQLPDDIILDESLPGGMLPYSQAIQKKENYLAKLKEQEFNEKEGKLVRRDIVFSQLFDFATIKRDRLLAIPDRITDDLMSLTDRNEFYKLLYDSIANELETLSELKEIDFTHE